MAYEKTVWQSGDLITAERMNKIEQRLEEKINGGTGDLFFVEIINVNPPTDPNAIFEHKLNKTWQEIHDAFIEGKTVFIDDEKIIEVAYFFDGVETHYYVDRFSCLSQNDYPSEIAY